jgi:hypothetical protein
MHKGALCICFYLYGRSPASSILLMSDLETDMICLSSRAGRGFRTAPAPVTRP